MATFEYSALKDNKTLVKGKVDAPDKATARRKIREMGLQPTQVYDTNSEEAKKAREKVGKISTLSLR